MMTDRATLVALGTELGTRWSVVASAELDPVARVCLTAGVKPGDVLEAFRNDAVAIDKALVGELAQALLLNNEQRDDVLACCRAARDAFEAGLQALARQ